MGHVLSKKPMSVAIAAVKPDHLIQQLEHDPVGSHLLALLEALGTRIYSLTHFMGTGSALLSIIEVFDAFSACFGVTVRTLKNVLLDLKANRAFEVLWLDTKSPVWIEVRLLENFLCWGYCLNHHPCQ